MRPLNIVKGFKELMHAPPLGFMEPKREMLTHAMNQNNHPQRGEMVFEFTTSL